MGATRVAIASVMFIAGCFPSLFPDASSGGSQPQQQQQPPPQYAQQGYGPPPPSYAQAPTAQQPSGQPQGAPPSYPPQGAPPPYPGYTPAAYPQPYPPPPPPVDVVVTGRSHLHDGEVIGNFAAVGTLGAISLLDHQNTDNGNVVTAALIAGSVGGAGIGYLLTQKYDVDGGTAHTTTLGLTLGLANAALLVEPTGWDRSESILNLLFVGSAAGATTGFLYGHYSKLTAGQSTFVSNLTLLGTATAALGAITASTDGEFGGGENTALAIGLDGGAVAGALIAPNITWSARRSRLVLAGTVIGAFGGGMVAGLIANPDEGESRKDNGDVVAGAMTAGMWGGFALAILMTKEDNPDGGGTVRARTASSSSIAPWFGRDGHVGMMAGGTF